MKASINIKNTSYEVDFSKPIDISIPLRTGEDNVNAWYCDPVKIEPVVMGEWVGDVNQGASVNFRNVFLNPHGNGTHTECVGHISKENYTLNRQLKQFMFLAELISVTPEKIGDDFIITKAQLEALCNFENTEALVIRTLPNHDEKIKHHYSNTNPPYLHHEAATWLVEKGIKHLLLDLPSVDREQDQGQLLAHHAFWKYPKDTRLDCTITELVFVNDLVKDGLYLLNLQITSLENDASPSKPILYLIA